MPGVLDRRDDRRHEIGKGADRSGQHKTERYEESQQDPAAPDADDQLLAVHEVLDKFAKDHPVQAEVVKLRYFVGMTNEETSQVLGISVSSVNNYWMFSRTWILHAIKNA